MTEDDNKNMTAGTSAQEQTQAQPAAGSSGDADETKGGKKKRVRRTNEQIEADRKAEEDARRAVIIEELRSRGLIRDKEDEENCINANLDLYNKVRKMPANACKEIEDGPLKGKTDINPMARIKMLTELFGPYGQGWKWHIVGTPAILGEGENRMASVCVALYVRLQNGEWSEPSYGFGGSPFFRRGNMSLGMDDDCIKKATTDAFGTACKNFGMAADIFYAADADYETKYDNGGRKQQSFKEKLASAGTPITPQAPVETPAPATREEPKPEEKPAPAAPASTEGFSSAAAPAKAPAPAGECETLTEKHRSYTAILTYICSLKDKSAANLEKVRAGYREKKNLDIPDELWKKMIETATAA